VTALTEFRAIIRKATNKELIALLAKAKALNNETGEIIADAIRAEMGMRIANAL
jgi:hypothetical protein